jgi:hypothetical protein
MMAQGSVYVSITGLVLHSPLHWPRFAMHAGASMVQARRAPGNRFAAARMIDGVHHTLSIWDSRDAMLAYLRSGAHAQALRAFRGIGQGKTYGFETDTPPGWSDVPGLYAVHARPV